MVIAVWVRVPSLAPKKRPSEWKASFLVYGLGLERRIRKQSCGLFSRRGRVRGYGFAIRRIVKPYPKRMINGDCRRILFLLPSSSCTPYRGRPNGRPLFWYIDWGSKGGLENSPVDCFPAVGESEDMGAQSVGL